MKEGHPVDCQKLKYATNEPVCYKVFLSKNIAVVEDGNDVVYTTTIHPVACTGKAFQVVAIHFSVILVLIW